MQNLADRELEELSDRFTNLDRVQDLWRYGPGVGIVALAAVRLLVLCAQRGFGSC